MLYLLHPSTSSIILHPPPTFTPVSGERNLAALVQDRNHRNLQSHHLINLTAVPLPSALPSALLLPWENKDSKTGSCQARRGTTNFWGFHGHPPARLWTSVLENRTYLMLSSCLAHNFWPISTTWFLLKCAGIVCWYRRQWGALKTSLKRPLWAPMLGNPYTLWYTPSLVTVSSISVTCVECLLYMVEGPGYQDFVISNCQIINHVTLLQINLVAWNIHQLKLVYLLELVMACFSATRWIYQSCLTIIVGCCPLLLTLIYSNLYETTNQLSALLIPYSWSLRLDY